MSAAEEDEDKTRHQALERTLRFAQNDRERSEKAVSAEQYESKLDDSSRHTDVHLHGGQGTCGFRGRGDGLLIITGPLFTVVCD